MANRSILLEALPGIGQVASISGRYIASFFNLKRMGSFSASGMPPVAVIKNSRPEPPVSIYGGKLPDGTRLAVLTSEVPLPGDAAEAIAVGIMECARKMDASIIISPHGMVVEDTSVSRGVSVYGASSTVSGIRMLKNAGIETLEEGIITGVPGVLLCMRESAKRNTIALLVEVSDVSRDVPGAALMVHAIDRLALHYDLDCGPICRAAIELGAGHATKGKIKKEWPKMQTNSMYL